MAAPVMQLFACHLDSLAKQFFLNVSIMYVCMFICMPKCMQVCLGAVVHVWRPGNNFKESHLSYHHLDSGNQTQVLKLGIECFATLLALT